MISLKEKSKIIFEEFPGNKKNKEKLVEPINYNEKNKETKEKKNTFKYIILVIIILFLFLASSLFNKHILSLGY